LKTVDVESLPMADRSRVSAHHVLVVVLVVGFGAFVALHTALLFSGDQRMNRLVRLAWLGGLGLALALGISLAVGAPRPFRG
jgi:hypothetical protein